MHSYVFRSVRCSAVAFIILIFKTKTSDPNFPQGSFNLPKFSAKLLLQVSKAIPKLISCEKNRSNSNLITNH